MAFLPENRELNPDHVRELLSLVSKGPFYQLLGMRITDLRVGACCLEVPVTHKLLNAFGGIHGGVYAAIMDTVTYWSLYGDVAENEGYATLDLNVNDLGSVSSGTLIAHGRAVRAGRHILLGEAKITDEKGRLLAAATSKMYMSPSVQPMSQMVANLDPTVKLPPKFVEKPVVRETPEATLRPGD